MITTPSQHIYVRMARLVRVVDGDTIEAEIDLGFKVKWTSFVRFHGIDVYETRGVQASPYGPMATTFLEKLFAEHAPDGRFYLYADRDKIAIYNRIEAQLFLETTKGQWLDVIETLRASGFEKGGAPTPDYPHLMFRVAPNIVEAVFHTTLAGRP